MTGRLPSPRRLRDGVSDSSGQVALLFVVMLLLLGLMGVITVDVGLMLVDRRDAQGDADAIAMAGALELPQFEAAQADARVAAVQAAEAWALANGVDPATELTLTVLWNDNCFTLQGSPLPAYVGVKATVEREPLSVFAGFIPGLNDVTFSSSALACSGSPVEMNGFLPLAVSQSDACFEGPPEDRIPIFGKRCDMIVDSSANGLIGQLGVPLSGDCPDGNPSASVFATNLENGAQVFCAMYGEVKGNPGFNVGKTRSGLSNRLATDGECDSNLPPWGQAPFAAGNAAMNALYTPLQSPALNNGVDDLFEVWGYAGDPASPASGLETYDCDPATDGAQTSPRNVSVIVVANYAAPDGGCGPKCYIVRGFARMYLEGCTHNGIFYKDCNHKGGGPFMLHGRLLSSFVTTPFRLGFSRFGDVETFLKE